MPGCKVAGWLGRRRRQCGLVWISQWVEFLEQLLAFIGCSLVVLFLLWCFLPQPLTITPGRFLLLQTSAFLMQKLPEHILMFFFGGDGHLWTNPRLAESFLNCSTSDPNMRKYPCSTLFGHVCLKPMHSPLKNVGCKTRLRSTPKARKLNPVISPNCSRLMDIRKGISYINTWFRRSMLAGANNWSSDPGIYLLV